MLKLHFLETRDHIGLYIETKNLVCIVVYSNTWTGNPDTFVIKWTQKKSAGFSFQKIKFKLYTKDDLGESSDTWKLQLKIISQSIFA